MRLMLVLACIGILVLGGCALSLMSVREVAQPSDTTLSCEQLLIEMATADAQAQHSVESSPLARGLEVVGHAVADLLDLIGLKHLVVELVSKGFALFPEILKSHVEASRINAAKRHEFLSQLYRRSCEPDPKEADADLERIESTMH